jgi:uncharacterized protein
MPANFLHGVETTVVKTGPRPVRVVKSAVIGLVGIAPTGPTNEPILVLNDQDAAQFGQPVPGFNIPQALRAIFAQGAGTVIVVNTLESGDLSTVTGESIVIAESKAALDYAPIADLVITDDATPTPAVLTLGTDYTVDAYGNVTIPAGSSVVEGDTLLASYKRLNPSAVNAAQIIGTVDGTTAARTGMKAFDLSFANFGFNPRIFIAPDYSHLATVKAEMITYAEKYRGFALIDSVAGWTRAQAIADRGPAGTIFNTSSYSAALLYPRLKAYDPATDADVVVPFSAYFAGVWTSTINSEGYWVSPSNKEIKGITGVERKLTSSYTDAQTDVQILNENGIVSLINSFGTGIRTYGNRSAAFPVNTDPENFLAVRMTAGVLYDSVEQAMVQFIDRPINNALIDAITETVNGFIRTLVSRGALIDGECTYDPAKNSPTQIAGGQLVFDLAFMPPVPGERITFEAFIDINFLQSLGTN